MFAYAPPVVRSSLTWALVTALAAACADAPTRPLEVHRIELVPGAVELRIQESRLEVARAFAASGALVALPAVSWHTDDSTIVKVDRDGLITAVGPGAATVSASVGSVVATAAVRVRLAPVSRLVVPLGAIEALEGTTATLMVVPVDADGAPAIGWPVQWSVADTGIARVSAAGIITAVRAGATMLRVRVDTFLVERPLRVRHGVDLAVAGLSLAQVIQNEAGSVPMILGGGLPIAVNVYLTSDARLVASAWVRARCTSASGVRWEDSVRVEQALPAAMAIGEPVVQFLMPNQRAALELGCSAEVDPARQVHDSTRENNRFPRTGLLAVTGVEVPPLDLTFVPVVLAADGGATGDVNPSNLAQYLGAVRQMLPVGRVNARVAAPLVTSTQLGQGGDVAWRAILRELEAKRVVDGAGGHFYGVLRPGAGVSSVQFSGFGYIAGWSALGVQVGWFDREATARETVAHELGHNFGRPHAPCGAVAGPDTEYPYLNAELGAQGWDVASAVAAGLGRVRAVAGDARDLMSYCRPVWVSDYSYRRMIAGRAALLASAASRDGSAFLVRGEVSAEGARLDPVFPVDAAPTPSDAAGVPLEALNASGQVIARFHAPRLENEHGATTSFVAVVSLPDGVTMAAVRVVSRSGRVLHERRLDPAVATVTATVSSGVGGGLQLSWNARQASDVMVRDARTGEVRAFGSGGVLALPPGTGPVQVAFSNGWRTRAPL